MVTASAPQNARAAQETIQKATSPTSPTGRTAVLRGAFRALVRTKRPPQSAHSLHSLYAEGGVNQLPEVSEHYKSASEFSSAVNSVYQEWMSGLEGHDRGPQSQVEGVFEMPGNTAFTRVHGIEGLFELPTR